MIKRAGIALGRLTYDSDFSITRVDRSLESTLLPPVRHKLVDGHSIEEVFGIFDSVLNSDPDSRCNGLTVSIPISASSEQKRAFRDKSRRSSSINDLLVHDHLYHWAISYANTLKWREKKVNFLFIDLTPGQVASKLAHGDIDAKKFYVRGSGYNRASLEVDSLTTQSLYEKLVATLVSPETKLRRVGILRPEGTFPDVSSADLEAIFKDTLVEWLTLDDLSRCAAVTDREPPKRRHYAYEPESKCVPTGIMLSNGKVAEILPSSAEFPIKETVYLTTSQDNQTTATVQLYQGSELFVEVKLEGLIPRPKRQAAIRITLTFNWIKTLIVEELGTDLKKTKSLENLLSNRESPIHEAYHKSTDKQIVMPLGENGFIGELPE
ncbi:hypothetical protein CPB86DRAFT_791307 [Serendipita vermifera]|nr:hypothetical protein CPB86DRAFT_791307 [Serendipita vermifera]